MVPVTSFYLPAEILQSAIPRGQINGTAGMASAPARCMDRASPIINLISKAHNYSLRHRYYYSHFINTHTHTHRCRIRHRSQETSSRQSWKLAPGPSGVPSQCYPGWQAWPQNSRVTPRTSLETHRTLRLVPHHPRQKDNKTKFRRWERAWGRGNRETRLD